MLTLVPNDWCDDLRAAGGGARAAEVRVHWWLRRGPVVGRQVLSMWAFCGYAWAWLSVPPRNSLPGRPLGACSAPCLFSSRTPEIMFHSIQPKIAVPRIAQNRPFCIALFLQRSSCWSVDFPIFHFLTPYLDIISCRTTTLSPVPVSDFHMMNTLVVFAF